MPETCGAPTLRSGPCSREPRPGSDRCSWHDPIPPSRHTLPDGSVNVRSLLAEWDADYNRHAGPPRPDDRKDTHR